MTKKILYGLLAAVIFTGLIIFFKKRETIEFSPIPIKRYEISLMAIDTDRVAEEMSRLFETYALFSYGWDVNDRIWQQQILNFVTCPRSKDLLEQVLEKYPDLHWLERKLGESFARYNRLFERDIIPTIYTYISHLDYDNRVIFLDTALVIGLDMYLGPDNEHYNAIALQMFKRARLDKQFIPADAMRAVAHYELEHFPQRLVNLLDHMILHGKVIYFLSQVLPKVDMATRLGYTPEQMAWVRRNEKKVWAYIVGEKLLYEQNIMRYRQLVLEVPSLQVFPGSPGRIGHYFGYQIVKRFMDNTDTTIPELFAETDSQKILRLSNFRP